MDKCHYVNHLSSFTFFLEFKIFIHRLSRFHPHVFTDFTSIFYKPYDQGLRLIHLLTPPKKITLNLLLLNYVCCAIYSTGRKELFTTMKLICSKSNLLHGVNIVSKAVPTRTTMAILECILIDASANEIKLTANDMELGNRDEDRR